MDNNTTKISQQQFIILVILFTVGGIILIGPTALTSATKQDAWIASIVGLLVGSLFVLLYNTLAKHFPNNTLVESCEIVFGRWLGKMISLLYISYFFHLAGDMVREVGDFLITMILHETPIEAIQILWVFVGIMAVQLGIETIARTAQILFPWFVIFLILTFLTVSPEFKLENLQPSLENGLKPIIMVQSSFLGLPFLELVMFLMLFPYVEEPQKTSKTFLKGVLIGGIIIVATTCVSLLVLGADLTARSQYPIYSVAQMINIGNFLQRIEAIIAGVWFMSMFFKFAFCFYITVVGLAQTLNLKDYHFLTYPVGIITVVFAIVESPNLTYYKFFRREIWTPYSSVYGLVIPIVMLLIWKIWRKRHSE